MRTDYQINLFYGYEENECGIYHAFQDEDPDTFHGDGMADVLADMLDISADDDNFNWNSMYISLPRSLIDKIKADGVREYFESIG